MWIRASSIAEVKAAGSLKKAEVKGVNIVIGVVGDRPFAFEASCPHKGGPLVQGELVDDIVRCPWHKYEFDVFTGKVLVIPYPPKYGEWRKTGNLRTYQARVVHEEIYVDI